MTKELEMLAEETDTLLARIEAKIATAEAVDKLDCFDNHEVEEARADAFNDMRDLLIRWVEAVDYPE